MIYKRSREKKNPKREGIFITYFIPKLQGLLPKVYWQRYRSKEITKKSIQVR
jgi:hypothetical protein